MASVQPILDMSFRVNVIQGQHCIGDNPNTVLTTILGSCVAACLWDPVANVGGMNHFLLPGDNIKKIPSSSVDTQRYGVYLMELLMNDLFRSGAIKSRLKAKLFGGAAIVRGLTDIGALNIAFAEGFLHKEGVELVGGSAGGIYGRKIQFWPVGGRARQAFITSEIDSIIREETKILPVIQKSAGNVEFF